MKSANAGWRRGRLLAAGVLVLTAQPLRAQEVSLSMPRTADQSFIDMMVPHHEQGIAMARQAVEKATHPELRVLAQKMIDEQSRENEQMRQWRQSWFGSAQTPPPMMTMEMPAGPQFDRMFMEEMFKHHGMSITTAVITTRSAARGAVKELAGKIAGSQHADRETMAGWLRAWYGVDPPTG